MDKDTQQIRGILERWDPKPEKHPDLKAVLIRPEEAEEGEWFTTFARIEPPARGTRVLAEYVVKGENRNITDLVVLEAPKSSKVGDKPRSRRDNIDARTALMVAKDYAVHSDQAITANVMLQLADQFHQWLTAKAQADPAAAG